MYAIKIWHIPPLLGKSLIMGIIFFALCDIIAQNTDYFVNMKPGKIIGQILTKV